MMMFVLLVYFVLEINKNENGGLAYFFLSFFFVSYVSGVLNDRISKCKI